jgi:hypothetical protein
MLSPLSSGRAWFSGWGPFTCAVAALVFWNACAAAAESGGRQIPIPLSVMQLPRGTYKVDVSIGFGNLRPLPMSFDTGSAGLHVFAAAGLAVPGSGVDCTQTPVSFTVGNPGRVTYEGVICNAVLHFEGFTTPVPVPIAYLTAAKCTPDNPHCRVPNLNDPRAHGGVYGVFGAGITGAMPVRNPLLAAAVSTYSIALTRTGGELLLGGAQPGGAVEFPLAAGNRAGTKWRNGQACLFVNGKATGSCLTVSFDTGNGVPWIRDSDTAAIPQQHGLVAPQTRIGFGPPGAGEAATTVVAGAAFASRIKVELATRAPLTNTGIESFFGHVVTYDDLNGRISIAPWHAQP